METDQLKQLFKEDNVSRKLWFKYFPYWPLLLILLTLSLFSAWLYLRYSSPVYESNASIIIKDNKRGIEEAKIIGELNQLSTSTIVENEMEVLKSRALAGEVVKTLSLYAQIYEETKLGVRSAYSTSPIKIEVQNPDLIIEDTKIKFTYNKSTNTVILNARRYPLNQWINTEFGNLRFSPQNPRGTAESPLFFLLINPKSVALDILGKLDVSSNKISSVVNLKIQDEDPARSEDILNELIHAYNRASINDKNTLAANTLSFVEERLKNVTEDLDSIENLLQKYTSSKDAMDISTQGKLFLESVNTNDQKLSEINMKLAVLSTIKNNILNKNNHTSPVPSTLGLDDPMLSSLLTMLNNLETQQEKLKQTTGENNPEYLTLSAQILKIRPTILENINSQQQSLEINKRNLNVANNSYNSMIRDLPLKQRNLIDISREQNIKSSIYNYLLQKREETALSHSAVPDSRLIDKAEATLKPIGPKKKPIYLLAFGLAFGVTILIVYIRHSFNRTILFRHEIEEMTNVSIIGEIAMNKQKASMIIQKGDKTFIAEQFRKLRISLDHIGIGAKRKKILVTSTISGEGKSFITFNLGLILAMSGKKVVIVEFDLSNPALAIKLNCKSDKGITNYLTGDTEEEEIIKPTDVHKNLFLIPAGPLPDDPSDLILNYRVGELFAYLENKFDYILVDSAPVGILSDGYVLSKYCDATLYIVRHRYTPKIMLERLDKNNKINELKNMALVFNGINSRGLSKAYGYGYGYGYGYIEKRAIKKSY